MESFMNFSKTTAILFASVLSILLFTNCSGNKIAVISNSKVTYTDRQSLVEMIETQNECVIDTLYFDLYHQGGDASYLIGSGVKENQNFIVAYPLKISERLLSNNKKVFFKLEGLNIETHSCMPYNCDLCEFLRDKNGYIIGCDNIDSKEENAGCNHSLSQKSPR